MAGFVGPDYVVKSYSYDLKKIVRMKNGACSRVNWDDVPCSTSENKKIGDKFYSSFIRAKNTFFDIVMCNEWDYFCTFTLDPQKYDRYNLSRFRKDLGQFIRDMRKRGYDISFAFVPERHRDGAWHLHGLLRCPQLWEDLRPFEAGKHPRKLVDGTLEKQWRWWPDYQERFGFCSLSPIVNHEACCRYVCKYITKEMAKVNASLNAQLYTCSVGLKRPDKCHVYGAVPELDRQCSLDTAYAYVGYDYMKDSELLTYCCTGGNDVYINGKRVGGEVVCDVWDDFYEVSDGDFVDVFLFPPPLSS